MLVKKVQISNIKLTILPLFQNELPTKNNTLKTVEDDDDICIIEHEVASKSSSNLSKTAKSNDDELLMAIDVKPEIDQMNISEPQFPFIIPSSIQLKNICQIFGLICDNSALRGIWHKIEFSTFNKFSNTIVTDEFKTKNIFELFSILLTNSPSKYAAIQDKINQELQDECKNDGYLTQFQCQQF